MRLRTAWDKRIILANCHKLKEYCQKFGAKLGISPDEPLEMRRKKMLDRIKSRAENDGKVVSVTNGVLTDDGIEVFSIKDGKLVNDG
jgi:hypothetical protein